jgi:hypothetical protein
MFTHIEAKQIVHLNVDKYKYVKSHNCSSCQIFEFFSLYLFTWIWSDDSHVYTDWSILVSRIILFVSVTWFHVPLHTGVRVDVGKKSRIYEKNRHGLLFVFLDKKKDVHDITSVIIITIEVTHEFHLKQVSHTSCYTKKRINQR